MGVQIKRKSMVDRMATSHERMVLAAGLSALVVIAGAAVSFLSLRGHHLPVKRV
jgi:hypothetical protein